MAVQYDKSMYYVDFSDRENLTKAEKERLEYIQQMFRPLERVDYLTEFRMLDKISSDDFEKMTGVPYNFGN